MFLVDKVRGNFFRAGESGRIKQNKFQYGESCENNLNWNWVGNKDEEKVTPKAISGIGGELGNFFLLSLPEKGKKAPCYVNRVRRRKLELSISRSLLNIYGMENQKRFV